jgi:exodeoxyribonuclease VII small subunit
MSNPIPLNQSYDQALAELEEIIKAIEEETMGIDEFTIKVKTAAELLIFCRQKLRSTEEEIGNHFENMNTQ